MGVAAQRVIIRPFGWAGPVATLLLAAYLQLLTGPWGPPWLLVCASYLLPWQRYPRLALTGLWGGGLAMDILYQTTPLGLIALQFVCCGYFLSILKRTWQLEAPWQWVVGGVCAFGAALGVIVLVVEGVAPHFSVDWVAAMAHALWAWPVLYWFVKNA